MPSPRTLPLAALLASCVARSGPAADAALPTGAGDPARPVPKTTLHETRRDDLVETLHGVAVADPYRWLEDGKDPAVQAWLERHDGETRKALAGLPRRERLEGRFRELYYRDSISPPWHEGARYFYTRRHADKEKTVYYFREGDAGREQVLLDPNTLSDDGSVSLAALSISPDGRYVAYSLSKNNADDATLHVRDVDTGEDTGDVIEGARYAYPSWTPDARGFYYVGLPTDPGIDPRELPGKAELRFHRLGAAAAQDEVIVPASGDPQKFVGGGVSRDGRWLIYEISHGSASSDVYYRDLRAPAPRAGAGEKDRFAAAGLRPLVVGQDAHYGVTVFKDRFYVETDEGAPNGRVFVVDPKQPARARWREIVPERPGAVLQGASVVGGLLALTYLEDAYGRMEVRDLAGKHVRDVPLPGLGSPSGMIGREDEDDAYFYYDSFTEAPTIFRTSMKTGAVAVWDRIAIKADLTPYTAEQVRYRSKDGAEVTMFVVRRKDMPRDGSTRFLLSGYGGFGASQTADFSTEWIPWLELGGGVALPNLRGGAEYGEAWHRAGMLARKQNVFDDFIAAAEFLVREKYTSPQHLGISGASNGGLLVGAAMVQRPDLFAAVLCGVPLLDMLRYHKFGAGQTWIAEYGSADDPAQFEYLRAYSPYHNVEPGARYPALLLITADSDDRVDPMHARKFAAAVAAAAAPPHRVLLRVVRNAGHGGADLVRQAVELSSEEFAFLADALQL